jgi:hypothetical protein
MKEIKANEFKLFLEGKELKQTATITRKNFTKEIEVDVLFVLVKTAACPKCEALLKKSQEVFGDLEGQIVYYIFDPKHTEISDYFTILDIASVPVLVTRYREKNGDLKLGKVIPDYDEGFINLTNTFDALNENDQRFFGYNEFDEIIEESDYDHMMNRILRTIYGEIDPEIEKERKKYKSCIN